MFTSLLDSSPLRRPVLNKVQWAASLLAGIVCSGVALSVLRAFVTPQTRFAVLTAAGLGLIVALETLMLCYISADAPRFGSRAWPWLLLTLFLSLFGFLVYLAYSARKTSDWKRIAIPMAYVFQLGLVCLLVMLPLIYTQALPESPWIREMLNPPTPPARYHAPSRASGARQAREATPHELPAPPTRIPARVAIVHDLPTEPVSYASPGLSVPGGIDEPGGGPYNPPSFVPPPPPPAVPPAAKKQVPVVLRSSVVEAAKLIYAPKPDYPRIAQMAHVQGTVKLEALISADGTIQGLKVIGGHPLLVQAAVDTVARWRYQPTLLNGEAVEVQTEIDVVFTLAE